MTVAYMYVDTIVKDSTYHSKYPEFDIIIMGKHVDTRVTGFHIMMHLSFICKQKKKERKVKQTGQ